VLPGGPVADIDGQRRGDKPDIGADELADNNGTER
jgi:hypothetical protein